jgi:hypothetical protein
VENQPVIIEEKSTNNNRNLIIALVVVVILCCFCLIVGIAGYYAYTTISSRQVLPAQPNETITPPEITPESDTSIGDPPSGGLGNDVLRNDTWKVMAPAAIGLGCDQPLGADSTIEVLQQPDASGHWTEKWTVVCNSGKSYVFQVDFILDDTGATFNIKSLP